MPKPHRIKFTVDDDLKTQLTAVAVARGLSRSALIRLILKEYLRQKGENARY